MIEMPTFQQILEMDDEDDGTNFSKEIVFEFFGQAVSTFDKMEDALYVVFHKSPSFSFSSTLNDNNFVSSISLTNSSNGVKSYI
jgi:hypothetical protein